MIWDLDKTEKLKELVIHALKGFKQAKASFYWYPYAPEDELTCVQEFNIAARQLRHRGYSVDCVYLSQLLIQALDNLEYLDIENVLKDRSQSFVDIEEGLRRELPRAIVSALTPTLKEDGRHCAILLRVASLYPFVHPFALQAEMQGRVDGVIVLPVPGSRDGTILGDSQLVGHSNYRGTWL